LNRHQQLQGDLYVVLIPPARARGLVGSTDTALYRPGREDTDYRIPDLVVSAPERRARRGVAGRAELVVEIQSSGDESFKKVPFYAEMGCQEILIIDRDTLALVLFLQGERQPEADGYDLASLGMRIERIDGPQLAVTWQGDTTVITPFSG
jgi:Uma2 family endonuclease